MYTLTLFLVNGSETQTQVDEENYNKFRAWFKNANQPLFIQDVQAQEVGLTPGSIVVYSAMPVYSC